MVHLHASAPIPASADRTWATVADLSRFGEWLTLHAGWRGEVPTELSEGATITSVVAVLGLRKRIVWRVERYRPPAGLSISGRGVGGLRVAMDLAVRPDGADRAALTLDAEVTGRGVAGPLRAIIGRAVRTELRRSVTALTGLVG